MRQLGGETREEGWGNQGWVALREASRREFVQIGFVAFVVVGGLFLPSLFTSTIMPNPRVVARYLPVVWQVLGAAMGLTIAVLIFSFQSFAVSPHAGSLREFARYTYTLPIALIGFLAPLVDGLAYLGLGTDAPYGWAGAWAIWMSLLSIASLPLLTYMLLRALEPNALHESRLARLSEMVAKSVDKDILRRLALGELQGHCEVNGWDFRPLFGAPDAAGWSSVDAKKEGVVYDVDLSVFARHSTVADQDTPVFLVDLGQQVVAGTKLASLPPESPDALKAAVERSVRIRKRSPGRSPVEDAVRLLHKQSTQAIRDSDPVTLDEIGKAYKSLLIALPHAWSKYGAEVFDESLARPIDWISWSPVDRVSRQLFLETRAVVRTKDAELIEEMTGTVYSILLAAAPLGADAISKAASSLLVHAYTLAAESSDQETREVGTDNPSTFLLEFLSHQAYRLRPESPEAERTAAERQCRIASSALTDLLRAAIDNDRVRDVQDIHRAWTNTTSLWLRWRGDPDPAAQALVRLVEYEEEQRIGLSFWALRAGRRGSTETARPVLEYFAGGFGGASGVLEAANRAIRLSIEGDE